MGNILQSLTLICGIAVCSSALADGSSSSESAPIFVYASYGNIDGVNATDHGILIDWLDSLETRANKPDQAAMFDLLISFDQQERLQDAFGCTFTAPSEPCQEVILVVEEPDPYGVSESTVEQLFSDHNVSRAWILQTSEKANKEGYVFTVLAVDFEVSPEGVQRKEELMVWHREIWSDGADAHSRGLDMRDRSAKPKIGSHEARARYWQAGSPPRLEQLMKEAPGSTSELLRYLREYTAGMTYKDYKQKIKSLKMVRDSNLYGGAKCRASHGWCRFRVVDKTDDRVRLLYYAGYPWMVSANIPGFY